MRTWRCKKTPQVWLSYSHFHLWLFLIFKLGTPEKHAVKAADCMILMTIILMSSAVTVVLHECTVRTYVRRQYCSINTLHDCTTDDVLDLADLNALTIIADVKC
jgi:hypothetical protein